MRALRRSIDCLKNCTSDTMVNRSGVVRVTRQCTTSTSLFPAFFPRNQPPDQHSRMFGDIYEGNLINVPCGHLYSVVMPSNMADHDGMKHGVYCFLVRRYNIFLRDMGLCSLWSG